MGILLSAIFGLFILCISEVLWRRKLVNGEGARKFVHITAGVYIAFLPFFISYREVILIGVGTALATMVIHYFKIFKGVYDVSRTSFGEIIWAVAIIGLAFLEPQPIIFAAATLHVALADGLAALVGKKFGKNNQYKVFGHTKSVIGTITFWLVSAAITTWAVAISNGGLSANWSVILWLPPVVALLENVAIFGVDNLTILAVVAGVLSWLKIY